MNKYIYYILLFSIFGYGIFLRFYDLGTPSFWIDEGYSSIVSYYANINNLLPLTPFGNYDFSQYFFTLLQSLSFSIFGISDFSARFPSFLFSIFSMVLVYFFSRDLLKDSKYRDYGVVFVTFLFTFSSWQIIWSREARFYELLSFIYLFSVWSLWRYISLKTVCHPELRPKKSPGGISGSFEILNNGYIKDSETSSEGQDEKQKYFYLFSISTLIGMLFHPFCFALFVVGILLFLYDILENYIENKKFSVKYKVFFLLITLFFLYLLIDGYIKYNTSGSVNLSSSIPTGFDMSEDIKKGYIKFYLDNLFSQLGFIFIMFISSLFYYSSNLKIRQFLLFGALFIINFYVITQKGYMAHTRYMFHLYGIITVVGGYFVFLLIEKIFLLSSPLRENGLGVRVIFIFIILILSFSTFKLNLIPQPTYDIDYTSPKPNFKGAYDFLKNKADLKIISGFPHLCVWYNLNNKTVCKYALRVNLTGDTKYDKDLKKETNHNYTNTLYLNKIDDIKFSDYYFVLDNLTIKNSLNKEIINKVTSSCDKVFTDLGGNRDYNFIGVYKCR